MVEADEFDRTFLKLFPYLSVITAMDPDHLDIYGTPQAMYQAYQDYAGQVSRILIYHHQLQFPIKEGRSNYTYGLDNINHQVDFYTSNIHVKDGIFCFTIHGINGFQMEAFSPMPGRTNVENVLAACAAAYLLGVSDTLILQALKNFQGIERRFELCYRNEMSDVTLISDYAHHPVELRVAISAARELYVGKRVIGIFQPHLFTRTRDFMNEFAKELSTLDQVYLTPIYPAREQSIEGITSEALLAKINNSSKKMIESDQLEQLLSGEKKAVILLYQINK